MTVLLALETSGRSGSVAVARMASDALVIEQESLDPEFGSARTLAPAIDRLLHRLDLRPTDLGCLGVLQGPGSFTGLRVGAATAKVMAWALGIPLVAVDSLDVIAAQVAGLTTSSTVVPAHLLAVIDAYRGQMFAAEYSLDGTEFHTLRPTAVEDIEAIRARIDTSSVEPIAIAGPGASKLQREWERGESTSVQRVVQYFKGPESTPMATTVARLAWTRWQQGKTEDVLAFLPTYYRSSAAEEKQGERHVDNRR